MNQRKVKKKRRGQRDLTADVHELRYEVGENEHGSRLDAFIARRVSWRSRAGVRSWIEQGSVDILPFKDPQRALIGQIKVGMKLRIGQEVVVRQQNPQPAQGDFSLDPGDLEIIFEDDWLIAVNKPPHINVHPSHGHLTGSLIHLIHQRHRSVYGETDNMPTLCHRLDRETSGVLLCAKDQLGRTRLGRQFEARSIDKTYLALVQGVILEEEGVLKWPLGKSLDSGVRLKMGVREDGEGQASITEWRVEQRFYETTLVRLHPLTGRQHQLRVHLAHFGHPIVGDKLYLGGDDVFIRSVNQELTEKDRETLMMGRQALHNWRLKIEHPYTGKPLCLEAPLFQDITLKINAEKTG